MGFVIKGEEQHRWWRRRIHRCRPRKGSTPRPSSDSSVLLASVPRFSIQIVAFSLQLQFIVPALLSHISPSRRTQPGPPRRVIPRLDLKSSSRFLVCSAVGASWVVVGRRWVSLEGRVRGWLDASSYYCTYSASHSLVQTRNHHPSSLRF
jgi:hypothetical protein